jgi:phosphoribosylanthranilate isomerase
MIRVKICCIGSMYEAQHAMQAGAAALGLVGHMPSGPGVIPDAQIKTIARHIPPPIATFLLTSETSAEGIIEHHRKVHTSTLQIVDALAEGHYQEIRAALPTVKLVQVIHVVGESAIQQAEHLAPQVDAILLDSGNPALPIKELGGTGRTHHWDISRQIVEAVPVPVFLAGGLDAQNIEQAIDIVHPFGVDICSGVRTGNSLDPEKLQALMEKVNEVDNK